MEFDSFFSNGQSLITNIHYATTMRIKSIKRVFMGEGKMMRIYKLIRTLYNSGDSQGLLCLKNTLETEMPSYHSARYTKQVELILYIDYLLEAPNISYKMLTHKRYELIKAIDTTHEIGRKIVLTL